MSTANIPNPIILPCINTLKANLQTNLLHRSRRLAQHIHNIDTLAHAQVIPTLPKVLESPWKLPGTIRLDHTQYVRKFAGIRGFVEVQSVDHALILPEHQFWTGGYIGVTHLSSRDELFG